MVGVWGWGLAIERAGKSIDWRLFDTWETSFVRRKHMMPSLLIVVLVLQLAIHLINTVGAQAINDLVSPLPFPASSSYHASLDDGWNWF